MGGGGLPLPLVRLVVALPVIDQNLVDLTDDPLQAVQVEPVGVTVGRDRGDRDRPARGSSLALEILEGLPVEEEGRVDRRRRLEMFRRREPSLLHGRDDLVRDLRVPDPERVIEDVD